MLRKILIKLNLVYNLFSFRLDKNIILDSDIPTNWKNEE
jgi:hypothetical protein